MPDPGDISEVQRDAFNAGYRQAAKDMEQVTNGMLASSSTTQLNRSIDGLDFTIRTNSVLTRAKIYTVGNLLAYTKAALLKLPSSNDNFITEVDEVLERAGLQRFEKNR